jgi:hypothetical protein
MDAVQSNYNGLTFDKPSGLSNAEWSDTKKQLFATEGSRLFTNAKESTPAASGKVFSIPTPMEGTVEFAADVKKRGRKPAADVQAIDIVE